MLYPREYITGLPSNTHTHTHTRMHYFHPRYTGRLALDGYIRDCDLRYRKLLSKTRPKTRGGCIKFLTSGMTATRRRCLPSLLHEEKIPSNYLLNKQILSVKFIKWMLYQDQARKETIAFHINKSWFLSMRVMFLS